MAQTILETGRIAKPQAEPPRKRRAIYGHCPNIYRYE
jgi:hypothetical protein